MRYVAIVGRPNVGKSTLFNRIIGERRAVVEDRPGVTRDRLVAETQWNGKHFAMIDTGGLLPPEGEEADEIVQLVLQQVHIAMEQADVILFLTDGTSGLTTVDEEIAQELRSQHKPVLLVVNKVDRRSFAPYEFYALGLGEPHAISAEHGTGVGDLLDRLVAALPDEEKEPPPRDRIAVAIVGRPNVGKSSLFNALLGEERVVVSSIAGTTRDAIDTDLSALGRDFRLIDTAGLRRPGRILEKTERYSALRAKRSLERADVGLLVVDATAGLLDYDVHIAGMAWESGAALLVAFNKWDAVEREPRYADRLRAEIRNRLSFAPGVRSLFISAMTGRHVSEILPAIIELADLRHRHFSSSLLNEILREAVQLTPPPTEKGKRARLSFVTQVVDGPPTLVIFGRHTDLLHFSYRRFLENRFREVLPLDGIPLRLIFREEKRDIH